MFFSSRAAFQKARFWPIRVVQKLLPICFFFQKSRYRTTLRRARPFGCWPTPSVSSPIHQKMAIQLSQVPGFYWGASLGIGGARSPLPKNFCGSKVNKMAWPSSTYPLNHAFQQGSFWFESPVNYPALDRTGFFSAVTNCFMPRAARNPLRGLGSGNWPSGHTSPSSVPKCLLDPVNSGLGPRLNDSNRDYYAPSWLLATLAPSLSNKSSRRRQDMRSHRVICV